MPHAAKDEIQIVIDKDTDRSVCASRTNAATPYLGKGSFATVFLGEHNPSGQQVAIKVIGIGKWYEKNRDRLKIKHMDYYN